MQSPIFNEKSVSSSSAIRDDRDVIFIEGLICQAQIGVLDSERGRRQSLRFDVEIEAVSNYRSIVRETGEYISYADTVFFIEDRIENGGHIDLVEEWADQVAEFVLKNKLAQCVTVKVTKPDIFTQADGVGICVRRSRI